MGHGFSAVPNRLNGTEFSQEEFRDNLRLRYGLMLQEIPTTYDGCGKKFLIEHALSCPNGGLVIVRHNNAAKEWGPLGSQAVVPSAITYEPKINSRTVQGERTGAGARQDGGEANGGTDTVCRTLNRCGHISRATGTGSSTCIVEGRRKRPRLLEAGDHRNV